ncbi:MAG: hypothetical protein KatS3mg042_0210 [Rhodothermaceae bacterium]|nr:MAG: hypothetical protein KatS3mg042_0210 [Rhodothermaceae bacterium]
MARPALAQAWTQPAGGLYVKLMRAHVTAATQWDFDGTEKPYAPGIEGTAFFDRSFYAYVEYGLTDRLTLVSLVPFKRVEVRDGRFAYETSGLGSVTLGLRWGLPVLFGVPLRRSAASISVLAVLPTGYTRNLTPSLGPGQTDVEVALGYGLSLYPLPAYLQAGLGYRIRSDFYGLSRARPCPAPSAPAPSAPAPSAPASCVVDERPAYADEWRFSAEAGLNLGRWALLQTLVHGSWSNQPPETGFNPANPIPTRTRFVKTGAGLTLYPMPRLGLSTQVFRTPFGRNTLRSTDWFFGLEYRLP